MRSPVCNNNPETTVACHFNASWAGKGMGQKADDCAVFFGCSDCHRWYDEESSILTYDQSWLLQAYYRTIRSLLDMGVLK